MTTPARRLTWRGKILMVLLSPLVVFGLVELGLRFCGYRYEPWKEYLDGRFYTELSQRELYAPDPDLIWTMRRSTVLDLPECGFHGVRTNSDGLRGDDLPGPKVPGEFRVLCLGNSITFGPGLRDGETWPDRMAEALRASPVMRGRTIRVINAGVPGWSTVQGMRLLDRIGDLDSDAIVFWYGLPDSHRMRVLPDSTQSLPVEGGPRVLAVAWNLRVFQLVQQVVIGVRSSCGETTRVSRAEFRAAVDRVGDLQTPDGPQVIYIREPERMDVTAAELERIVDRAERERVDHIFGSMRLLSPFSPAGPANPDLTGRRIVTGDGLTGLCFRSEPPHVMRKVDEVREDLELLQDRKAAHDALMDLLPVTSLDYRDLFGKAPPITVLSDNSHLTVRGARLAGKAIAVETLRRIGGGGR